MLNLEKLLKRLRAGDDDVECFHYNGHVTKCILKQPDVKTFMFYDAWCKGISNATEQLRDVANELERNKLFHQVTANVGGLPLHDSIKYILVKGYRFPLYVCGESATANPQSLDEMDDMISQIAATMKALHDAGFVVWDFNPKSILQLMWADPTSTSTKIYIMAPSVLNNIRLASFKNMTSIIQGCTIISPYQILLDMLCSKFEHAENEMNEFKIKMMKFWSMILKQEYKHVPDVCQFYQSLHKGSSDYVDTILCRWCKLRQDSNLNKTYVVKDPRLLLKTDLFRCMDWFAFGVTIDELLEKILEKDPKMSPRKELTQTIYDCLCMNEPRALLDNLVI